MTNVAPAEPQPPGPSGRSAPTVEGLIRNFRNDSDRAAQVGRLATQFFDAGAEAHGLPSRFGELVAASSRLHGLAVSSGGINAAHVLLQNGIDGLNASDVALVAAAVDLHGSGPDSDILVRLRPERVSIARQMASITAIAVALADAGASDATVSYVDTTRRTLRLHVRVDAAAVDLTAVNTTAHGWQTAWARPLRFVADGGERYHLRPGDTMQAAGHKVFERLYADARSREDGVRRDTDIEDLHKFRVATRRLRAALRAFRPVFGRAMLQATSNAARTVARSTNAARDLDVFLEGLEDADFLERVPSLTRDVRDARAVAIQETLAVLDGDAYAAFRGSTESLLAATHPLACVSGRRKAARKAGAAAAAMVGQRLRGVLAYVGVVSADDDAGLHDLRIATKQLRYVLEFFADVLPDATRDVINDMKGLQDSLGDVNDCAVQRDYVAAAVQARHSADGVSDVEHVATELLIARTELRRERCLHTFRAEWDRFTAPENQRLVADRLNL
jgi:CHAD domain-containing protein